MKRIISLILITTIVFTVNTTFGYSINNNDGSAFITKAEFDALKSNFQSQIDEYNINIDSKIDNAIASYLSGVKIITETCDYTLFSSFPVTIIQSLDASKDLQCEIGRIGFDINYNHFDGFSAGLRGNAYQNLCKIIYGLLKRAPVPSKRILLEEFENNGVTSYRFNTYATNLKQTITQTIFMRMLDTDSGFGNLATPDWGGYYWNVNKNFQTRTKMTAGQWGTAFTTYTDDWKNTGRGVVYGSNETHSSKYTFDENNNYDYVYYSTLVNSKSLGYNQLINENDYFTNYLDNTVSPKINQYNEWYNNWNFTSFRLNQCHSGSSGAKSWTTYYKRSYDPSSSSYSKWKMGSYGVIAAAPVLNMETYDQIYHKDSTKYQYVDEDGTSQTLHNYKLTAGIPFYIVNKDTIVYWDYKFDETEDKYIWFSYGPFENESEPSTSTLLKSSVDNGVTYNNYSTIGDSGRITLKIERPGLIFVKWRLKDNVNGGGKLLVSDSKNLTIKNNY